MSSLHRSNPLLISRAKKERFLLSMSEEAFRDDVVRPLFLQLGLKDGRELCGPDEKGKDSVFVLLDQLGIRNIYALQTKKGTINLASEASQNLINIIAQLRTALDTPVLLIAPQRERLYPSKVILCASGRINEHAREHVVADIRDPRLAFMDRDDLIPLVDERLPELWFGIDAKLTPYFRALKSLLEESGSDLAFSDILPAASKGGAVTDAIYVTLYLHRTVPKLQRRKGQATVTPSVESIPAEALLRRKETLFLILGEAGSGKSTAMRRLAYSLVRDGLKSDRAYTIPILLRATDVADKATTPLVAICGDETSRITGSSSPCFSMDDLSNGRVAILVDALDELADDNARLAVLGLVREFHARYPKCKVITTSREYSFVRQLEDLRPYATYRVSPINYRQAAQIVSKVQKGSKKPIEASKEFVRRLQDVHGMELNPLLVTVFAATADYTRQDIPANITELFKKFTEVMMGRWDAGKGLAQQYQAPVKDFLLCRLAFEMHSRKVTSIPMREFEDLIKEDLAKRGLSPDIKQMTHELLDRSGLLRVVGDNIEFRHMLLQEFFAGRGTPSAEFLESVLCEEWWRRPIVFYFGQRASDAHGLEHATRSAETRPPQDCFVAAVTVGLALQACYLAETQEKSAVLSWVIDELAKAAPYFVGREGDPFPIMRFMGYYVVGRDSVASKLLEGRADQFLPESSREDGLTDAEREIKTFWIIAGLIECGALEEVERLVRRFLGAEPKLLMAIHLGCFLIAELRVATKEQRSRARRVSELVLPRIGPLRKQLLTELKANIELIEYRRGEVKALEAGREDEE